MTALTFAKAGAYVLGVGNAFVKSQTVDRSDKTAILRNLINLILIFPNNS
jgi:hypothetical protein